MRFYGVDVFARGRCFRSQMECMEFATKQIPGEQFQWFIYIVIYLHFFTGEMVSMAESQMD